MNSVTNAPRIQVASTDTATVPAGSVSATRTGVVFSATKISIIAARTNPVKTVGRVKIRRRISTSAPVPKDSQDQPAKKSTIRAPPILVPMERPAENLGRALTVNVLLDSPGLTAARISTNVRLNLAKMEALASMERTNLCATVQQPGKVFFVSSTWTNVL